MIERVKNPRIVEPLILFERSLFLLVLCDNEIAVPCLRSGD